MKFVLKQYDTALRSFDLRSEGLNGFACTLLEKEERHSLPANRLNTLETFLQLQIPFLISEGKSSFFSGRIPIGGVR